MSTGPGAGRVQEVHNEVVKKEREEVVIREMS